MNKELISYLEDFGLSNKEAKLYLSILDSIPLAANEIAQKAKLNRSTTYVLLEELAKKGLISSSVENKVKKYQPVAPERLIQYLEDKAQHYTALVGVAHHILPELKSQFTGSGLKPKIQYFEGEEGIKSAYEDTLTSTETIRALASIDSMHEVLPGYFPAYYQKRAEKGIHIRAILPDTPEAQERMKHNVSEQRTAHLVPASEYSFSPEINFYEDKTVFMSLREKYALIIESREITDALKKVFELAWAEAKRLHNTSLKKKMK